MEMKAISINADEVLLRPLEDDVQPPVAAEPANDRSTTNYPTNADGNEPSPLRPRAILDADAEGRSSFGQPLAPVAKIAERRTLEAIIGEFAQNRNDTSGVTDLPAKHRSPAGCHTRQRQPGF
jgi:hypothetical protein